MWLNASSRREFIKMASLAAASVATTGCVSNKLVNRFAEEGRNPADYPVVVIGAGMGGLASAVYLSRAGFPVTVIEQHSVPGGYATAFSRGDFKFDVSLHFFGLPEDVYRELGLDGKVERIPLDLTRRIVGRDYDILIPRLAPEERILGLCQRFPEDAQGIRSYFKFCFALVDELAGFVKRMETGSVFVPLMPLQYPKMWSVRNLSLAELIHQHVKHPMVVKSICSAVCGVLGLPPSQLSGMIGAAFTGGMANTQNYYFRSRSQDLSNALASVITDNKGTLIYGKTVKTILTAHDRVTGVQTDDGNVYPAKIVVSNASAPDTFGKFLSGHTKARQYMEQISRYKPSISSFLVWLGLAGEYHGKASEQSIYIDAGHDLEADFQNYLSCDAEKAPIIVVPYDNYYAGYSKPGTSTLTIMLLSGYEPWRKFEKDYWAGNKKDYQREKMRIAQTLIRRIEEKAIPGLSSMIRVMEVATPLTNITYTKNPESAIYGYPPSMDNAFINRIKNTTPIEGLYLSSGWGNFSGSYYGGIMNGRDVHRLVMKNM